MLSSAPRLLLRPTVSSTPSWLRLGWARVTRVTRATRVTRVVMSLGSLVSYSNFHRKPAHAHMNKSSYRYVSNTMAITTMALWPAGPASPGGQLRIDRATIATVVAMVAAQAGPRGLAVNNCSWVCVSNAAAVVGSRDACKLTTPGQRPSCSPVRTQSRGCGPWVLRSKN